MFLLRVIHAGEFGAVLGESAGQRLEFTIAWQLSLSLATWRTLPSPVRLLALYLLLSGEYLWVWRTDLI